MSPTQAEWVGPSAMDRGLCRRLMAQERSGWILGRSEALGCQSRCVKL